MMLHLSFSSIRVRLFLLIILTSIPILLFTIIGAVEERRAATVQIQAETLQLTQLTVSKQEQWIEGARQLLVSLAYLPAVRNRDSTACSEFFAELHKHYPLYANHVAATPDGDLFCSAVPLKQAVNSADLAWFKRAVSSRDFAVGDYQPKGRITGIPVLVTAYPIYDDEGNLQAIVTAALDLAWLNQQAAEMLSSPDMEFLAIDREGTILARYPDPEKWVGQSLPETGIIKTILSQQEGTEQVPSVDGITRLYAFAPVRNQGTNTGIFMSIGIPTSIAFAEINHRLVRDLTWLGIVILLMLLIAWFGGNVFVLRHMNTLVSATRRLGAGDLSMRIGVPYNQGEVGTLARVFDEMAEALEEREAERKQAEEALRESEEKYRTLVETADDVILLTDLNGRHLLRNSAYYTSLGYEVGDDVSLDGYSIVHPDDLPLLRSGTVRLLAEGTLTSEYRVRHKNGSWVYRSAKSRVVYDGARQPKAFLAIIRDVTERKQAEAEVRRNSEELAALNTLGRQVSQSLSLDGVVSEAVKEMVKVVQTDLAFIFLREGEKLTLAGIGPQGAAKKFGEMPEHRVGECMCGLAVTQGKPLYSQDIFTDMRCTWEECKKAGFRSFAALPLRSGEEIIGVVGLDCQAERDFESQAGFLETLASQVASGIRNAQLYEQTRQRLNELDTIHQAAQRLQILRTPESLAQTLIRILEENLDYEYGAVLLLDEQSDMLIPFALSEQGRGAEFVEMDKAYVASQRVQVGKGITGWVAQTGQSVCLGDVRNDPRYLSMRTGIRSELCVPLCVGKVVIGVVNTETSKPNAYTADDQRVLETIAAQIVVAIQNARLLEQVQRHAAELEQRVAERTAELQAANKELETFAYTVSHDLKAPLRGIDGYSRLLLEDYAGKLDEEGRQFLFNVRHAVGQMDDLIDDLLQYSRLERRAVTFGTVNLRALIEAILAERADEIRSRCVRVSKKISCESITADSEGLSMALRNLIDNALKFTVNVPQPDIEIVGRATEKGCIIEVHDNGVGFDMHYQERIFEMFQRLHRAEEYPGTGVGLAIVRKAVERMGGRAWAESEIGKGAVFYLELPGGDAATR